MTSAFVASPFPKYIAQMDVNGFYRSPDERYNDVCVSVTVGWNITLLRRKPLLYMGSMLRRERESSHVTRGNNKHTWTILHIILQGVPLLWTSSGPTSFVFFRQGHHICTHKTSLIIITKLKLKFCNIMLEILPPKCYLRFFFHQCIYNKSVHDYTIVTGMLLGIKKSLPMLPL